MSSDRIIQQKNFYGILSIMTDRFSLEIIPVYMLYISQVLSETYFLPLAFLWVRDIIFAVECILYYWWSWTFLYIYWTFIFLRTACCYFDHFSIGFKDFFHLINLYECIIDWWLLSFIMNLSNIFPNVSFVLNLYMTQNFSFSGNQIYW